MCDYKGRFVISRKREEVCDFMGGVGDYKGKVCGYKGKVCDYNRRRVFTTQGRRLQARVCDYNRNFVITACL